MNPDDRRVVPDLCIEDAKIIRLNGVLFPRDPLVIHARISESAADGNCVHA
jgi:hypothetical protein